MRAGSPSPRRRPCWTETRNAAQLLRVASDRGAGSLVVMGALEALQPVSLEEVDRRAALLRRVDTKYVLKRDAAERLLRELARDHDVLAIDGRRRFAYESIYFDTPRLRCFRDHVE